jgi:hypothetical protein
MMAQDEFQKKENFPPLRVLDGGVPRHERRSRTFSSGELRLDPDMKELMGAVTDDDGQPVTREFRRAIYDETKPHRVLARYVERAASASRGSARVEQLVLAIVDRLGAFVRERFARHRRRRAA